ncbi:MAG: hypothetical protein IPN63_07600 [Gammaproteobacteria bacterium]|nr:hypothetical protein [Gammaproteobacteria bacterium]
MSIQQHVSEAVAQKITLGGAGLSTASGLFGWLSENGAAISSIGVIVGIIVGLAGLTAQIIIHGRRDRREQREHEARMRALGGEGR